MPINANIPGVGIVAVPDGLTPEQQSQYIRRAAESKGVFIPAPERTFGQAVSDIGASTAGGFGALVALPGQLTGIAGLTDMDNALTRTGAAMQKFGQEHKSERLQQMERERAAKIAAEDTELGKAWVAFKETGLSPALFTSFLAEQAPQLLVGGVGAKAAKLAATGAAKVAGRELGEAALEKAATSGAVGAGVTAQGADIGSDTYQSVMKDKELDKTPEYKALIGQGLNPDEARKQLALSSAQKAAAGAGVASYLTSKLPGGRAIEEAIAGKFKPGIIRGIATTAPGELVSEGLEEGLGQVASNIARPGEQDITAGVGEAAAMGALGGLGMGTGVGALSGMVGGARERQRQAMEAAIEEERARDAAIPETTQLSHPQASEVPAEQIKTEANAFVSALPKDAEFGLDDVVKGTGDTINHGGDATAVVNNLLNRGEIVQLPGDKFKRIDDADRLVPALDADSRYVYTVPVERPGAEVNDGYQIEAPALKLSRTVKTQEELNKVKGLMTKSAAEKAKPIDAQIKTLKGQIDEINKGLEKATVTPRLKQKGLDYLAEGAQQDIGKLNDQIAQLEEQKATLTAEPIVTPINQRNEIEKGYQVREYRPDGAAKVLKDFATPEEAHKELIDNAPREQLEAIHQSTEPQFEPVRNELQKRIESVKPEEAPEAETPTEITPEMEQKLTAVTSRMRGILDQMGLQGIGLNVEQRLKEAVNGKLSPIDGKYLNRVISASLEGSRDVTATIGHETIHALRELGMFSDKEWNILTNKAKTEWIKKYDTEGRYKALGLSDEKIIEEAIADAFGDWLQNNLKERGVVAGLFNRIKLFLQKVGDVFRGQGFTNSEDVFKRARTGRLQGERVERTSEGTQFAAPQGIPENLWNLHQRAERAEAEASGEAELREAAPGRPMTPGALRRNQTIANRRLVRAAQEFYKGDVEKAIKLMREMTFISAIRRAQREQDDRALRRYQSIYPELYERETKGLQLALPRTVNVDGKERPTGVFDSSQLKVFQNEDFDTYSVYGPDDERIGPKFETVDEARDLANSLSKPIYPTVEGIENFWRWFGNSKTVNRFGVPQVWYHGTAREISKFEPKQAKAIFLTQDPEFAEGFASGSERFMIRNATKFVDEKIVEQAIRRGISNAVADGQVGRAAANDWLKHRNEWQTNELLTGALMSHMGDYVFDEIKKELPSGQNIIPIFVRAEKPFDYHNEGHIDDLTAWVESLDKQNPARKFILKTMDEIENGAWDRIESPAVQSFLKERGYDSFFVSEGGKKNLAVYDPNQLKSAVGNTGAFSRDSGEIQYALPLSNKERDDIVKRAKGDLELGAQMIRFAKNLTPTERSKLTRFSAVKMIDLLGTFPEADEYAAVAYAGRAKRGWYENSAKALVTVFGNDAPRFAALLAALSPQCSVQTNLLNALNLWKNWTAAGRPLERSKIMEIAGRSVQGDKGEESVLDAWKNNSVRALTSNDLSKLVISGPKVNSFFQNLIGVTEEVTNDAWMANFAFVDQKLFSGSLNKKGTEPGKKAGYLTQSFIVREAADRLTKLTGEKWTPAEVQETVWSWAKALYEGAEGEGVSAAQFLNDGKLTGELINSVPDFNGLFFDEVYESILREAGYGKQLDELVQQRNRNRAELSEEEQGLGGKTEPFGPITQKKLELRAANRLDRLKEHRVFEKVKKSKKANINFEVAPDPDDIGLTTAWNSLDEDSKRGISQRVMQKILPKVMEMLGVDGLAFSQVGSYGKDTNPSFSVKMKKGDTLNFTKYLGFVFLQNEMAVMSQTKFSGSGLVGAVTVDVGNAEQERIKQIYETLREIEVNGEQPVSGQSTINGNMVILNYSDVDTKELADLIDAKLGNKFGVKTTTIYAAYPSKSEYNYASPGDDPRGKERNIRERARALRAEASGEILAEIQKAGIRVEQRDIGTELHDAAKQDALDDLNKEAPAGPNEGLFAVPFKNYDSASYALDSIVKKVPTITRDISDRINLTGTSTSKTLWKCLTLGQLAEVTGKWFPQIKKFKQIMDEMFGYRDHLVYGAARIAEEWQTLTAKNGKIANAMSNVMHDATINGFDPDIERRKDIQTKKVIEPKNDIERDIQRRYDQLPAEYKALYKKVRNYYGWRMSEYMKLLEQRIEDAVQDKNKAREMVQRLKDRYETGRVAGPYFPLSRFGDYWVSFKLNGNPEYHMFENEKERDRFYVEMNSKGATDLNKGYKLSDIYGNNKNTFGFVKDIMENIETGKSVGELKDDIWQMYLRHLPEVSMRKHFIHRKNIAGYNTDALRAFQTNTFHGAYYMGRLKYSGKIADALTEAAHVASREVDNETRTKAQALVEELGQRESAMMNPSDSNWVTQLAGSFGFMYYLATPAAAMVNLTQNFLVAFPVMGGRFGYNRAGKELSRAMKQFTTSAQFKKQETAYNTLTSAFDVRRTLEQLQKEAASPADKKRYEYELKAIEDLYLNGSITRSQAMDMAGASDSVTQAGNALQTTNKFLGMAFHGAEVFNRTTTALAAYRMAMQDNAHMPFEQRHAKSVATASEIVEKAHFNYSSANEAPAFKSLGSAGKVLLMFKKYSQAMTYLLVNETKLYGSYLKNKFAGTPMEAEAVARAKEARNTMLGILGMTGTFAGLLGLPYPLVALTMAMFNMTFGGDDDDEYFDAEARFKDWLAETFGADAAIAIANGPVSYLTGADLSSRVGLNGLWFRDNGEAKDEVAAGQKWLIGILGPAAGTIMNVFEGQKRINEGQVYRGIEVMLPSILKDGMQAYRLGTEGALSMSGDPVVDEVTNYETFLTGIGFTSSRLARQYKENAEVKGAETRINTERKRILGRFALALNNDDYDAMDEIQADIEDFNQKNPEVEITYETLQRSLRSRQEAEAETEHGIRIGKKLKGRLSEHRYLEED